jgi:unsaturated rhamnogalacturonyl hydrolase
MRRASLVGACILAFAGCASGQAVSGPGPNSPEKPYYLWMAESVVKRAPVAEEKWDYTGGLMLWAIEQAGRRAQDPALLSYVQRNMDRFVQADGSIAVYDSTELSLDRIEPGNAILALWERTQEPRYRTAAGLLRRQLTRQPRTSEGGFWHKLIYPQQMWVDGIFMASPFYARYGQAFAEPAVYDDVAKQILLVSRHLRDPRTGLYWHGWDEDRKQIWADPVTGVSPSLWARGDGWYVMGLVDVLDVLPADHPDRPQMLQVLRDLAAALARVQDPATGLWWQVLDQPTRTGNYLEASGSAMFTYALAHAANRGYLPAEYRQAAERGFDGLSRQLLRRNADGTLSLTQNCAVAGLGGKQQRDGSFEYYVHEPIVTDDYKGVGSFILAALELNR